MRLVTACKKCAGQTDEIACLQGFQNFRFKRDDNGFEIFKKSFIKLYLKMLLN